MPSQQEYEGYIKEIEGELSEQRGMTTELSKANHDQVSLFNSENEENLIRWQLDLKEDLDRIYHLLRGDILIEKEDGSLDYDETKNPNAKPFNEFGVQIIMNIMQFYLNRNTILSNYDDETILWKVHDFGNELADLIFNRYEEMMVTLPPREEDEDEDEYEDKLRDHTRDKLKLYPMIVKELVDSAHSAYLRAYHAGERESLRTARTVTQSEPIGAGRMGMGNYNPQQSSFKWMSPSTWRR